MARKRHSPEQIAAALRQHEGGIAKAEVARRLDAQENAVLSEKKCFGDLGTPEIRELRQLREENGKLKRLVASLTPDKTMLQDALKNKATKPATLRSVVGHITEKYEVSERYASDTRGLFATPRFAIARNKAKLTNACASASSKSLRSACATAIGASRCCFVERAELSSTYSAFLE